MKTRMLRIRNLETLTKELLAPAVELLVNDQIIGFPTETVYGLGASIYSEQAIRELFRVKGRPQDNPLIVHISSIDMLAKIVQDIPAEVRNLCNKLWPGPLTLLFQKKSLVTDLVTAGLSTVAVRMPSHPVALALIKYAQVPIAAPSANLSGRPSPTTAEHVLHDLDGKIPLIIDGGMSSVGVESTVIDLHQHPPVILRPGGVNFEVLQKFIPDLQIYGKSGTNIHLEEKPPTPGLKYKHYSPNAYVILVEQPIDQMQRTIKNLYHIYKQEQKKMGLIHNHSNLRIPTEITEDSRVLIENLLNSQEESHTDLSPSIVAHGLFDSLRRLDEKGVEIIIVEGIPEDFEGLAVMNRLRKAASEIINE